MLGESQTNGGAEGAAAVRRMGQGDSFLLSSSASLMSFFQSLVDFLLAGAAEPAVADDSLMVQDEECGRTLEIPQTTNGAAVTRLVVGIGKQASSAFPCP